MCAVGALAIAGGAWGQRTPESTGPTSEPQQVVTLPDPQPHWVYALDPVFPHIIAGKIYIIDGDTRAYVGMLNTGYTSNMVIAPDKKALYVAETYWSRGSRGDRVDVVTFYNPNTLEPQGEARLPKGRYLVVPKKPNADMTPDGRYVLSYNMAPAMSVSVVDAKRKAYLGDIETPGCALNLPIANTRFVMVCMDGALATVTFDASGKGKVERGKPFFDVVKDPVFEHAAWSKSAQRGFFISFAGLVYPVDFSGGAAKVGSAWSLVEGADKGVWRPGGWQLAAYHPATNRLFVLMHEGGEWTHKRAGAEVWVFDGDSHKRLNRVKLEEHAISVAITQDAKPLLFTLSEVAVLSVHDGTSYAHRGDVKPVGDSPYLLYVAGE
jgi:methylamine dehydrogenase heavy chain